MTDLEAMKAMIERAGLKLNDNLSRPHEPRDDLYDNVDMYPPGHTCLVVEAGYSGFYSEMVFDGNGALIGIYAWE